MKTDIPTLLKIGVFVGIGFSIPFCIMQYFTTVLIYDDMMKEVEGITTPLHSDEDGDDNMAGLGKFDEISFGVSDFVQKANKARAIQGELERIIETIEGVCRARVQIAIRDTEPHLQNEDDKARASVFVDTGEFTLSKDQIIGIQNLVTYAVPDMTREGVTVIDNTGRNISIFNDSTQS